MASERIREYISEEMKDPDSGAIWDGTPDTLQYANNTGQRLPVDGVAILQWMHNCHEWNRRVRRDILVLEKLLVDRGTIIQADLYGDPGDPPPPPPEI
jgi:hypothetical protein